MFQPSGPKCTLTLFHADKRVPNSLCSNRIDLTISESGASRVHDTICGYFQLTNEGDKKLFQTTLSESAILDWYTFYRKDSPDVALVIKASEHTELLPPTRPEVFQPLDRGDRTIHITTHNSEGSKETDLTLKDLQGDKARRDLTAVAFYNCESFDQHDQASTGLASARTLQIIK